MKNKLYQNLENIATISWLLMDFCWMSKFTTLSFIFSGLAVIFSINSIIYYEGKSISEVFMLGATAFWVGSNSCWMFSDIPGKEHLIEHAQVFFVVSLIFIIIAIIIAKKEKKPINFKRLNIK